MPKSVTWSLKSSKKIAWVPIVIIVKIGPTLIGGDRLLVLENVGVRVFREIPHIILCSAKGHDAYYVR